MVDPLFVAPPLRCKGRGERLKIHKMVHVVVTLIPRDTSWVLKHLTLPETWYMLYTRRDQICRVVELSTTE